MLQQVDPNTPNVTAQDWFDQQGINQPNAQGMLTGGFSPIPLGNGVAPANDYVNMTPAAKQPTADQSPAVPSYVNLKDPTQMAVWSNFAQKGIAPRDQSDFQYWVDRINSTGGMTNSGNAQYWQNRMAQGQGGVGDYQERPEQGGGSTGTMAAPSGLPPGYTAPTYTLPSLADLQATPGYQFSQQQGEEGINRNAVAKGFSGGTLKDLQTFDTGLADQTYQNAVGNSLNAFGANTSAGQFGANYGLAANQQGFGQNLATNQFNLGAQNQYFGQGLAENQNAFNQYNTNQNTAFGQWLATAQLGNPGNPFA